VLVATRAVPGGWWTLAPLAGLTARPRSDRLVGAARPLVGLRRPTFVYLLFAALGPWLADRRRQLAFGLAGLLGAVVPGRSAARSSRSGRRR
jgi:hypothetical protein